MNISNSPCKQSGAALVVSLLLLVALTMMGVTSMRGSSTELTMAGNLRESALTFQAAEAGLSNAEAQLRIGATPASILADSAAEPNYLDNQTWEGANVTITDLALTNVATPPRYIIKSMGSWNPDQNVASLDPGFAGYGQVSSAQTVEYFRVTARGYGQTGVTHRTLQSFFGRAQ